VTFPVERIIKMVRYILFIFLSVKLLGQNPKADTVFCDCEAARVITLNGTAKIGKTIAPPGNGTKNEISAHKQKTKYAFEKEHHSAWYKLLINSNGNMCFDIIPTKADDDYDFMLFKAYKTNFCDSMQTHRIKPVRSCISRDKEDLKGKTGLNWKSEKEFVKEGIGDVFVKPIRVTKGEVYYLVLDNVYEKGEGHTIQFYFEEPVSIKGVITDENKKPIAADITLTNAKGDTLVSSKSQADGTYEFRTFLRKNNNYVMNFYNDSSFVYSKNIALKDSLVLKNIKTILPKLRKGVKYPIGNINFIGDSSAFLPSAIPSISNLYKLLSKNKSLAIQIEGHTNGCSRSKNFSQGLSDRRAMVIKKSLTKKGISELRINTKGKGCSEMLFPPDGTTEQQEQNRRVEVLVLEY